ncbi:hypothetical protein P7K49_033014 [Saguinus oedipus]|uniref:Uncharacterized protein n=1 Tax=Saguinus oedipus TaxID=9490 RepID=A0ABQ9TQP6_SAGOE|nr:hypothetical protein P7K49_033014 [Saguinus oedipus]
MASVPAAFCDGKWDEAMFGTQHQPGPLRPAQELRQTRALLQTAGGESSSLPPVGVDRTLEAPPGALVQDLYLGQTWAVGWASYLLWGSQGALQAGDSTSTALARLVQDRSCRQAHLEPQRQLQLAHVW